MATTEGLKPVSNDPTPIDPNVRVPEHVRAAAAAAEAIHKQAYTETPPETPPVLPETPPVLPETPPVLPETPPEPQPQPQPQLETPPPLKPGEENVTAEEWRHRFLSMQGRYNAAVRNTASMEEQMRQLADELVRTQNLVTTQTAPAAPGNAAPANHGNLITDSDRETYGDELLDVTRRAALSAVAPELERLRDENQRLTKRVQSTGRRELFATLDGAVPNWRAVEKSVQFKSWLRLPNIYTGQVRGQMLKAAVDGAEAPKVIALLRDFLAEAHATGQVAPTAQVEQQAPQQAPRTPALDLETLAAPGRARPASGDSQVPVERPTYSRAQIQEFYRQKNRGAYAGREAEAAAYEADFMAAQGQGRIR